MLPLVAAASVIAAVLSGGTDDEEDEFLRAVGLGGPDPDGPVNPDDHSLLQVVGVIESEPLYATDVGDNYVVDLNSSLEIAIRCAEEMKSDNETLEITEYTRLPSRIKARLDAEAGGGRGRGGMDGHEIGSLLKEAVRKEGASSSSEWEFNMREDADFSEWSDDLQNSERDHTLSSVPGGQIDAGTVLYTTTGSPEVWQSVVGQEVEDDQAADGIAAVTLRDEVKTFDLDVLGDEPDPTHVVALRVDQVIKGDTKWTRKGGVIYLGPNAEDWMIRHLGTVLDGVNLDVDHDVDPAAILKALAQYADSAALVLDYQASGKDAQLVVLPWNYRYKVTVLSVTPIGQLPLL